MSWHLKVPSVTACVAKDPAFSCRLLEAATFESDGDVARYGVRSPFPRLTNGSPADSKNGHVFVAFLIAASLSFVVGVYGLVTEFVEYLLRKGPW